MAAPEGETVRPGGRGDTSVGFWDWKDQFYDRANPAWKPKWKYSGRGNNGGRRRPQGAFSRAPAKGFWIALRGR